MYKMIKVFSGFGFGKEFGRTQDRERSAQGHFISEIAKLPVHSVIL
jgi:hypothetical protein